MSRFWAKNVCARAWDPLVDFGRQILGSPVFDYLFNTEGNLVEYFIGGDLVRTDALGIAPGFTRLAGAVGVSDERWQVSR